MRTIKHTFSVGFNRNAIPVFSFYCVMEDENYYYILYSFTDNNILTII